VNFTTLQTRAKLRLGNMQTSSPFNSYVDEWVNTAANAVVLRAMSQSHGAGKLNLFPELQYKWLFGPTVADQEFSILPGYNPITIAANNLTGSSTTATVDSTTHGMRTGDLAYIAGVDNDTDYNGTYTVTVTDSDTLTYTAFASLTSPATSTGTMTITLAPKLLFLYRVFSFDKTGADVSDDERKIVSETNWPTWELTTKDSTRTGYPRLWTRFGNKIYFDPVPRTSYTTDLYLIGLKENKTMVQTTDVPDVDARWHDAILDYVVYLGAKEMGWDELADRSLAACDKQILQTLSILGVENRYDGKTMKVKGDPTRP